MPLIDYTYFIGEINIPNTTDTPIQERLNLFIKKYEDQLLLKLFGYEMYKTYLAGAYLSGVLVVPLPQIWEDLINGVEYTNLNNILTKWNGLRDVTNKKSLIANYVYYYWMSDQYTQNVGLGTVQSKTENSFLVSPIDKMVRAWNEMIDLLYGGVTFLDKNYTSYTGWQQGSRSRLREFWYINSFGI